MTNLEERMFEAAMETSNVACKSCQVKTHSSFTKPAHGGGFVCQECIDLYFMRTCPSCQLVLTTEDVCNERACPNCGESL